LIHRDTANLPILTSADTKQHNIIGLLEDCNATGTDAILSKQDFVPKHPEHLNKTTGTDTIVLKDSSKQDFVPKHLEHLDETTGTAAIALKDSSKQDSVPKHLERLDETTGTDAIALKDFKDFWLIYQYLECECTGQLCNEVLRLQRRRFQLVDHSIELMHDTVQLYKHHEHERKQTSKRKELTKRVGLRVAGVVFSGVIFLSVLAGLQHNGVYRVGSTWSYASYSFLHCLDWFPTNCHQRCQLMAPPQHFEMAAVRVFLPSVVHYPYDCFP
jgi:hypothetical protein